MRVMPEFGSRPKRYGANRPTGITGLGSQHVPRFLCDEMLHGLGRWLRAARPGTRHGLCRRAPGFADQGPASRRDRGGHCLRCAGSGKRHRRNRTALRAALDIDWQHAPFSRCMVDNRPLEPAPPYLATQVPERSRPAGGPLRMCPECGRFYWPGDHVRRMQQRLTAWQREAPPPRLKGPFEVRSVSVAAGNQRHKCAVAVSL